MVIIRIFSTVVHAWKTHSILYNYFYLSKCRSIMSQFILFLRISITMVDGSDPSDTAAGFDNYSLLKSCTTYNGIVWNGEFFIEMRAANLPPSSQYYPSFLMERMRQNWQRSFKWNCLKSMAHNGEVASFTWSWNTVGCEKCENSLNIVTTPGVSSVVDST